MADSQEPIRHVKVDADIKNPINLAVGISIAIIVFVLTLFVSVGGAYLIAINNTDQIRANEAALHTRELESSVRTSIPTCRALIGLDDAKNGASNASSDPHSYGHNLARAITKVVDDTGCRKLISEVNAGVPIMKIAQQQQKATDGNGN